MILIISFIVSLKFLIEMDTIDHEMMEGVIEFDRNERNLVTEIKRRHKETVMQPSAPSFETAFNPSAPLAMTETSKNLFVLNIGPNHDFLRRSGRHHDNPSFSPDN